jgi:transcriptional regulator of NAD metabolism
MGSGKARVLVVAAEFGLSEARGVESANELYEVARKNVAHFQQLEFHLPSFSGCPNMKS